MCGGQLCWAAGGALKLHLDGIAATLLSAPGTGGRDDGEAVRVHSRLPFFLTGGADYLLLLLEKNTGSGQLPCPPPAPQAGSVQKN